MEIKISYEDLRKRKLFVATPMYAGQCVGAYSESMLGLAVMCFKMGIEMKTYFLYNESLITRARNYAADEFMRSDSTHMLFIDADIAFNPKDVITMLALSDHEDPDNPYDILAGPYPKKNISWEKVRDAVNKGYGEENAEELSNFVGEYVINPIEGRSTLDLTKPQEVLEVGTGFMLIKRSTFELFQKHYPEQSYKPDHKRTEHFDGSREIFAYFDTPICPETKRYLSEDYMFCQWIRKAGGSVWLCPWISLKHVGTYIFGGSLAHIAAIGAAATIDPNKLKKKK